MGHNRLKQFVPPLQHVEFGDQLVDLMVEGDHPVQGGDHLLLGRLEGFELLVTGVELGDAAARAR